VYIIFIMPSLASLIDPATTALVTQECQNGVIGPKAGLPSLAEEAQREAVPNIIRLLESARTAGVTVVHGCAVRRPDGRGTNVNCRLFAAARKIDLEPDSHEAALLDGFGPDPDDIVLTRLHGLSPMASTSLDPVLRNLGIRTIIGVGVSVNVAITNFAMDAVNAGYQFVLPRDAVAGVPRAYAESIIDNTLSVIATVTTTDQIIEEWGRHRLNPN
jgi:nicotinamidase-related amidase